MACVPWVPNLGFYIITGLLLVLCVLVGLMHRGLVRHNERLRREHLKP